MAVSTGTAILGSAALGALGGSKKGGSSTSSTAPWTGQQPYLHNLFGRAEGLYNRGPFDYVANQSPFTAQAQQLMAQRALDPNSLVGRSQGVLGDTISGKYLTPDSNPFLQQSVNDALGLAKSQFAGQYGGRAGGNLGNSGYQEMLMRTLGNVATNAYSDAYGRERQNQLTATQLAPSLDYANLGALANVGAQQEALAQQQYLSPWENLQRYQNAVGGQGYGSQSTTPYFTDPLGQALGYGVAGGQLYKMFGGGFNPWAGSGAPAGMGTGMLPGIGMGGYDPW
jgi:hypothetical protein